MKIKDVKRQRISAVEKKVSHQSKLLLHIYRPLNCILRHIADAVDGAWYKLRQVLCPQTIPQEAYFPAQCHGMSLPGHLG